MADYAWSALTPRDAAGFLSTLARPWWIAGGWAIDLFLGRETRKHADLDIAMLHGDEVALPAALPGWELNAIHDGKFVVWDGAQPLRMPDHQFWTRRNVNGPWDLEVLLEDHGEGDWLFRRTDRVRVPLAEFGRRTADDVPYVTPEIALLYKAKGWEIDKNAADFEVAAPALDDSARAWLRGALEIAHPQHPWIARL